MHLTSTPHTCPQPHNTHTLRDLTSTAEPTDRNISPSKVGLPLTSRFAKQRLLRRERLNIPRPPRTPGSPPLPSLKPAAIEVMFHPLHRETKHANLSRNSFLGQGAAGKYLFSEQTEELFSLRGVFSEQLLLLLAQIPHFLLHIVHLSSDQSSKRKRAGRQQASEQAA